MKICPYCKESIEDNFPFCPNCNKPLISNLRDIFNGSLKREFDKPQFTNHNIEEETVPYEDTIVKDDKIENELQKIDEVLERKEILGDPIPGSLLIEKSSLYYKKRDLSNALKNLELALNNFEKEDDFLNVAICHNEIGLIQEDTGFFDQAIYHFNISLEILKELEDDKKVINVLNNLGNVYYLIKDLEHSYEFYQEALDLSKEKKLMFEEVKSSSNLVEIIFMLKDYDRIKRILERNIEFFKQNEDAFGIITTLIKYGKFYYFIGEEYDVAFEEFQKALGLIDRIKDSLSVYLKAKFEWEIFLYLGRIFVIWEDFTHAESLLLQSLEAVRIFEIGEGINEGEILETLANFYAKMGDGDKSIDYYKLSYEIYYKFGDRVKCAEIKFTLGTLSLKYEIEKSNAIKNFEEALEIYEDLNYMKECAEIFYKLGDIYIEKALPEVALENLRRAREYYKELQDTYNAHLINEKIKSLNNVDETSDT
ncbi:MAG: tetratricopeptide repeat protein [Candidatus Thorarchaeota archaeon]